MSRRTVKRWWRSEFVQTPFWRLAQGRFAEPVAHEELPSSCCRGSAVMTRGSWCLPRLVNALCYRSIVHATASDIRIIDSTYVVTDDLLD